MRLTAHQPTYFPWQGFWAKIMASDAFVFFDGCPTESSGYENRVRIPNAHGVEQWLTVPVRRTQETKIKDVLVCDDQPWRRKHYRTLELTYGKAPHWSRYSQFLREFYAEPRLSLAKMNEEAIRFVLADIEIERPIYHLSDMGLTSTKSQLVLDMCLKVGASEYVFGMQGKDYADVAAFRAAGVAPLIQSYPTDEPWSILDSLCKRGPAVTRRMLERGSVEPME